MDKDEGMYNQPYELRKRNRKEEYLSNPTLHKPKTKYILDLDRGRYFNRTLKSWRRCFFFYAVFYAVLVAFWAIYFVLYMLSISPEMVTWPRSQPGLAFEPTRNKSPSNYVSWRKGNRYDVDVIVSIIDGMLKKYGDPDKDVPGRYGDCTLQNSFGYFANEPCIFLKVNRVLGFKLDPYERAKDLPGDTSRELRDYVAALPPAERSGRLWLSCESSPKLRTTFFPGPWVPQEAINVNKKIKYNKGFYSSRDFQRVVAVKFYAMPINRNINVKCYMWGKNIEIVREVDISDGTGTVALDFYIEP